MNALLNDGAARRVLSAHQLHAPHLVDTEIASALRRRVARDAMPAAPAERALAVWGQLAVTRYAAAPLWHRVWALRDNLSAYDATYVALAEALQVDLLTADARLARAPHVRCTVTVVPD